MQTLMIEYLSAFPLLALGQPPPPAKQTSTLITVVPQENGKALLAWIDNTGRLHYEGTALHPSLAKRSDFTALTLFLDKLYLLTREGVLYMENGRRFSPDIVFIEAVTCAQSMTVRLRSGEWVSYNSPSDIDGVTVNYFPLQKPPAAEALTVTGLGTPIYVKEGKGYIRQYEQYQYIRSNPNRKLITGVPAMYDGRRLYESVMSGGPYWKAGSDQTGLGCFFVAEKSITIGTFMFCSSSNGSNFGDRRHKDEIIADIYPVTHEFPISIVDAQSFAVDRGMSTVPFALLLADGSLYFSELPVSKRYVILPKRVIAIHIQGTNGIAVIYEDQTAAFYLVGKKGLVLQREPPRPSRVHFAGHE